MNDFHYSHTHTYKNPRSFDPNSSESVTRLDRLEQLCEVHHSVATCPVLFFLWHRDWDSLKLYFFINDEKAHTREAWKRYLVWCETLLSNAFDLRIFLLQHKEWIQEMLEYANPERRATMTYVVNNITDFIEDYQQVMKTQNGFWRDLVKIDLKGLPYLIMYSKIGLD